MKRYIAYITALFIAFAMIGCGGSSEPTQQGKIVLSGVAVDDLILNGVVRAYAAGNETNVLAAGRTDTANGSYTLDVSYSGVVVVEVTCDASSLMKPVSGPAVPCESGLKLHSAIPITPASGAVRVNISPLSELVVRQMQQHGTSENDFLAAQNNISLMFGVDPINDNPVENVKYGHIIDAIHTLAGSNKSIMEIVGEIGDDLDDGKAESTISAQLAVAMGNQGVSNNLTLYNGAYEPNPNSATYNDVVAAKTFFNELRTQAMSITDYQNSGTPGFLDGEAVNLGNSLEHVVLDGEDIAKWIGVMFQIIDNVEKGGGLPISGDGITMQRVDASTPGNYSYTMTYDTNQYSGNFTIPNIDSINMSDFTPINATISGTLPIRDFESLPAGTVNRQEFNANATITKTAAGANLILSASIGSNGAQLEINTLNVDVEYGVEGSGNDQEAVNISAKLNMLSVIGQIQGYDIGGNISTMNYVTNPTMQDNQGKVPSKILFTGGIKNTVTNGEINGSIAVELKNAADMNMSDESDDEPELKVDISGSIGMPSHPVMNSEIHYDSNSTSQTAYNNLQFSYSYGSTAVNSVSTFSKEGGNGTIELSNQNGITVNINVQNNDVVYGPQSNVSRNSKVIGEIQKRQNVPVVSYIDGSFESLP